MAGRGGFDEDAERLGCELVGAGQDESPMPAPMSGSA